MTEAPQATIIGHGRFGAALAALLEDAGLQVKAFDPHADIPPHRVASSLAEAIAGARFIFLATPVTAIGATAQAVVRALLRERPQRPCQVPGTWQPPAILIDVASVKVRPAAAMAAACGEEIAWVATHPLFGPASLALGERPLRVVVCPSDAHPTATDAVRALYRRLGCEVLDLDADAHDRLMAETHALGFFVAKGLLDAGATFEAPHTPPSAQGLTRTLRAVRSDAGHLLGVLHRENAHAPPMRRRLLDALTRLDDTLSLPAPTDTPEPALAIPDLGARSPVLRQVRELIDEIDTELLTLLRRRVSLARRAAQAKATIGAEVRDPSREAALLAERTRRGVALGLDPTTVETFFRAVLRLSVALQEGENPAPD